MNRRGINMLLIEAIVMTAVMAAALSICLSVFTAASSMRQEADTLSRASSLVFSAAQCYVSTGDTAAVSVLMGGDGGNLSIEGITLTFEQQEGYAVISASKDGELILSQNVCQGVQP